MAGVLNLNVVEIGSFITGPAASMFLADLGADVVKIERTGSGDPFRSFKGGLYSPHFQTYNRNKRSIELDTTKPEDLEVADKLVGDADVFIHNFRPRTVDKLGLDYARLSAINPRLIYCAISGFGQTGPARDRPAFDTVAQAASGFLHLMVPPGEKRVVGPAIADAVTGLHAALGILAAVQQRSRTGKGCLVDISMLEAMCYFNLDSFTHYFAIDEVMGPYSRPSVSQSYVFECSDGKWVALHMSSPPKFWEGLARALGLDDLFADPIFADRQARIHNQAEIIGRLAPIFKSRSRTEWCSRLEASEVPYSPVYDSTEALQDPQAQHLQIEVGASEPGHENYRTVRPPYSFNGARSLDVSPPPTLGQHSLEIREKLERSRGF